MGVQPSLAHSTAIPAEGAMPGHPYSLSDQVHPLIPYYWHKTLATLHRARVSACSKGLRQSFSRLTSPPPPGPHSADTRTWTEEARPGRPRLLFIDATTPRPDRDSGSLRLHSLMSRLVETGYAVDFLPDDGRDAGEYGRSLIAAGIGIAGRPGIVSPPAWALDNYRLYDAIVVSRYYLANAWTPLLKRLPQCPRIVLDTVDLHYLRESREAEIRGNAELARAARSTRRRELSAIRAADVAWVVSAAEKEILQREMPDKQVEVISNLHRPISAVAPHANRSGLLFVGSGRHPPNIDAVDWLVREILPLLRTRLADCPVHIVGEGLLDSLRIAAPDVMAHGYVTDLGPLLAQCRVGLAPLRFGAGVKGKINQYMAHGLPVVATPCATEGMHLHDGVDVVEASTAEDFADAIARTYNDPVLWQRLSTGGIDNVGRHFSFEATLPAIRRTFAPVAAAPA